MNEEEHISHEVLYRRAKQSEMMQGIVDTLYLVKQEFERLRAFHNYYNSSSYMVTIEQQVNQMVSYGYNVQQEILELRKKGL